MSNKTSLHGEYVNFVDITRKQNNYLGICTMILVFIVIILSNIRVFRYLNEH